MSTTPRIKLETETFPNGELGIVSLSGRETISQLFEYELLVVCSDPSGLEPEELCGQMAALVYSKDDVELRRVYGMISVVNDRLETETAFTTFRLVFVPRAYRLTLIETLDVFLDISVPDVIRSKLTEAGFRERNPGENPPADSSAGQPLGQNQGGYDFEMRLHEDYPERDFIVQYQETDLAFVSRLAEHLGICFFFEHSGGRDVMVFTDVNEGFRPVEGAPSVPFRGRGDHRDVYSFEETIRMIPAQYVVRDYNYRTPQITLDGRAQVPTGLGGIVEYGSHVKTPEEADRMAHVRAQERMAQRRTYEGVSEVGTLSAGAKLVIEGHPRGDTRLILTEVKQRAKQVTHGYTSDGEAFFIAEFKAISETRRYRPPRLTPRPRIHGVITGVIDSAMDGTKYADVDDQGRYRVRFLFDTTDPSKGQASKLVRMAQPHAGEGYGIHFPLRPGVEVIITFVDGDPDRPIIAATVPNPQTASPVIAGNAPRNIIRTGGGNEINFDDTHDNTRIKMSVPHKSTTFQLGSPNSPEGGAMLETSGASSTVATSGIAGFTSIKSGINAIGEWKKGGFINTVAEKPDLLAKASTVTEIMAAGIETASAVFEMAMSAWEANIARLKVDSIKDSVTAQTDTATATASRTDATGTKLSDVQTPVAAAATTYDDAVTAKVLAQTTPYATAEAALRAKYPVDSAAYKAAEADLLSQTGMSASKDATYAAAKQAASDANVKPYDDKVDEAIDTGTSQYAVAEKALRATTPVGSPGYAAAEAALLQQSGMADSRTALYDAVDTANPALKTQKETFEASEQASELNEKLTKYKESQEEYEAAQLALRTDQEFLRDAEKGVKTGTYTSEKETYEKAVAADQARMDAAKAALASSQTDVDTALATSPAVPALAGKGDKQTALLAAVNKSKADDATSESSWDTAEKSKKAYDTAVEEKETGDGAQGVGWTQQSLGFLKIGVSLFSEIFSAIALAKELKEKVEEMGKKLDAVAVVGNSLTRDAPVPFAPRTPGIGGNMIFPIRHTIGSEGDTEVYAEKNLFMRAEHTTLLGEETLVLTTYDQLSLLSQEKAEIAAREKVLVSSTLVDISADDELKLSAVPLSANVPGKVAHPALIGPMPLGAANEGKLTATSKAKMKFESMDDDIEIRATAKGGKTQKITLDSGEKIALTTAEMAVTAADKADLLAGVWGLNAVSDASGAGSVTLGSAAGWQLKIADKKIDLGVKDNAQLQITDTTIKLGTGGTTTFGGDTVTFAATTVDFGQAKINTENLMVKGAPVAATFLALKGQIETAQGVAVGAQKAAEAAQKTADTANETANEALGAAGEAQTTADSAKRKAQEAKVALAKLTLVM